MNTVLCVGIATLDRILAVDRHPTEPGKYRATSRAVAGGGVAANAAVTVARLGGEARFLGVVGDDEAGRAITDSLAIEGVDVSMLRVAPGRLSPESVVLIDSTGERLIVNHASPDLFDLATPPAIGEIGRPDIVLTDMRWRAGSVAALEAARALDVPGIVDCDHDPRDAPGILEEASHVIFGRSTLESWTGARDLGAALAVARSRLDAWVAVTSGSEGTSWLEAGRVAHVEAFDVDAVDTLGAGDVFHGAFALGLAEGMGPRPAIAFASAAAALKCTRFGGRAGIPTRGELERFLSERLEHR
jgi:sulfofructose kinase